MNRFRLLITVLFLTVSLNCLISYASVKNFHSVRRKSGFDFIQKDQDLIIQAGKMIPRYPFKGWSEINHFTKIETVFLYLNSHSDLEKIASLLSEKNSERKQEVFTKLKVRKPQLPRETALISMDELLPKIVKEKTNTFPELKSSNCFYSAMKWDGLNLDEQIVTSKEMEIHLRNNYSEVRPGDTLKFGDLIIFRDQNNKNYLLHVTRYIDKNLVWQKSGIENFDGWEFQTLDFILATYNIHMPDSKVSVQVYRRVPNLLSLRKNFGQSNASLN